MIDQDWEDDSEYHRAVSRAWAMVAIASCCSLLLLGLVAIAVLGMGGFLLLVEALG